MQADAYAGFSRLYETNLKGGPIVEAACWAHGRRKFFDLARLSKAPIAAEAVKRIDVLCNIAGGFRMGAPVHETKDADWDFLFNLNARSVLYTSRAVVPAMLKAGGSKHHSELLAPFGLNASDPGFWKKGLRVIEGMIDELETMG